MPIAARLLIITCLICGPDTRAELLPATAQNAAVVPLTPAEILYQVTKFIHWPVPPDSDATPYFVVGILGHDTIAPVLGRQLQGRQVAGRPMVLRRVEHPAELRKCQIVFIGASERGRLRQILDALDGSGTLTVAAMDGFSDAGGMIGLPPDPTRPRFSINRLQMQRAGLAASSRLLRMATIVRGEGGAE